jgi:hypothetical protein
MKKKLQLLFIAVFVFGISLASMAQLAEPGDGSGGDPNDDPGGGVVGGGAPIGSGLVIIIGMGLAYGTKKVFKLNSIEEI